MKKLSMMLTLIATVMMSIVGCKPDPQEPVVKAPTITVAEASVDAATMKASVEVTPSENTADWYWKVDTANAAGEYTKVSGNAATTIEVTVEYDTEYTFTAYAENKGGKSAEAKTVFVGPAAPVAGEVSLTLSEPSVNEESMKVVITVTPSENTAKWFYALTPQSAATVEPNYLQVDGNEVKTLTLDIVANEKYIFKAYAEDAEGNSSEPVSALFDAPTTEVEEESGNGELVKLELKNLTSVSVDADVLKYKECVRYVAGAVFKEAYNENRFISAAQNSLKPNESYPYVQYNSATTSKVWTEMDLVKDGLISKAENSGIVIISGMTYVVAVYAEDAEGNYKVYTEEFTAPAAVVDGTVDVKLTIDNIGMTDVTATITTDSECRIITGTRLAVGSGDNFNANTMSDEEIKQYLATNAASVPSMFYGNETIKFDRDMGIDTDYIVYAIAIKDGKIGNIAYEKFHTKRPELNGKGQILSASFEAQTDPYNLSYSLTTNEETKKIRVFFSTKVDYNNNKATLDFIMNSNEASYMWEEYEMEGTTIDITSEIYTPGGDQYAVFAMTFDAEGNPGQLVNLVNLWNSELEFIQTQAEVEVSNVDMTGTGEVKLIVDETITPDEEGNEFVSANIKVEAVSENIEKAWLVFYIEEMEKNIEAKIEEDLQGWDGTTESIVGAVKEITFAADEEIVYAGMYPYTNSYGGTIVAAVVLDKDGKFNVSEYHLAGSGDKNVEEKPDVPALTVSGDATIAVEEVLNQEGMINVKAQVTKVNDAFEFGWVLRFGEIKESELAANVTEAFSSFGSTGMIEGAAYSEIVFGEVKDYNFLTAYDEKWGGSILAVVGLNNDGTINLCDYYVAGTGNKGTIEQGGGDEPVVGGLYPELFKGATLSIVTENLSDPTAASATVKVSNVNSGVKTFILRIVGTPSEIGDLVAEAFDDYDGTEESIFGAVKEVTANDQEFKYEYMETYDEKWAEFAANIVVVEVSANGKPAIVAAYCCGEGVTNGTKEQEEGGDTPDVPTLTVSGDATIAVEEVLNQEGMINVKAQVTKVNNAFEFGWVLRFAEIKESELAANVTEAFADFGNSGMIEGAAYSEIVFGEVKDYNFLTEYAEEWGGSILAVVGLNNDGTINLCDYYVAGSGNKGTIEQGGGDEPVVGGLYPELFKGATLSVVTENLSDPTAASATVKVSNVKSGVKTFILRIVGTPSTLNAMVAEAFEDYDGTEDSIFGAVKEVTANDQEFKYEYMETYDEKWAEYAANIVVVEVVNNQPVVVAAYCCGEGVTNGTKEQEGGSTESGNIEFGGGTGNFGDINNVDFNGSTK